MWFSSVLKSWQLSEFDLSKLLTGRIFPPDLAFQFVSLGDFPSAASWGFSQEYTRTEISRVVRPEPGAFPLKVPPMQHVWSEPQLFSFCSRRRKEGH